MYLQDRFTHGEAMSEILWMIRASPSKSKHSMYHEICSILTSKGLLFVLHSIIEHLGICSSSIFIMNSLRGPSKCRWLKKISFFEIHQSSFSASARRTPCLVVYSGTSKVQHKLY